VAASLCPLLHPDLSVRDAADFEAELLSAHSSLLYLCLWRLRVDLGGKCPTSVIARPNVELRLPAGHHGHQERVFRVQVRNLCSSDWHWHLSLSLRIASCVTLNC